MRFWWSSSLPHGRKHEISLKPNQQNTNAISHLVPFFFLSSWGDSFFIRAALYCYIFRYRDTTDVRCNAAIFDEYDLWLNKMRWHFIFKSQHSKAQREYGTIYTDTFTQAQCCSFAQHSTQRAYLLFINCHHRNHIIFIHEHTGLSLAHFVCTYIFIYLHILFFSSLFFSVIVDVIVVVVVRISLAIVTGSSES